MRAQRADKLVVVIDDDALILEATEGLLRSWGCSVITAVSCGQAIQALNEIGKRPDLIVCDYRLPRGPSGVDVIETLRQTFRIPALLVSSDVQALQTEARRGGYHLLRKPVNAEALRAALVDAAVL